MLFHIRENLCPWTVKPVRENSRPLSFVCLVSTLGPAWRLNQQGGGWVNDLELLGPAFWVPRIGGRAPSPLFSLLPLSTSSSSPGFSATWLLCWREGERDRTGLRRSNPSSHACTMRFALTGNQDLGISSLTLRVGSQHFAGGQSGKLDMQRSREVGRERGCWG